MIDREQLLDELALVFAHAAVDVLIAQEANDDPRNEKTAPGQGTRFSQEALSDADSTPTPQ